MGIMLADDARRAEGLIDLQLLILQQYLATGDSKNVEVSRRCQDPRPRALRTLV
jgi:hypothetical protein